MIIPIVREPEQTFSHYPHIPPPVNVRLVTLSPTPCPYIPGRASFSRAIVASGVDPLIYHGFMDAGFRRSGLMLYQPICKGCRECRQIRVPVEGFRASKSQRRAARRNSDIVTTVSAPQATPEKFEVYQRYYSRWHTHDRETTWQEFVEFLYEFPSTTIEFVHRLGDRVVAAGLCDLCERSLSSVYFYFDPDFADRSLGTFGAMAELEWARVHQIPHYYLGYLIRSCPAMSYKANFRPFELLHMDGVWRTAN